MRILSIWIGRVCVLDDRERFISIDEPARVWHVAGPLRVDVDGGNRCAAGRVVDLASASGKISTADARRHNFRPSAIRPNRRDVDDRNPIRGVEDELVAFGRKRIVVEVQGRSAGIIRQPHHAMPGV